MANRMRANAGVYGTVVFIGVGIALIFAAILPLGSGFASWPGPDLLLAVAFAWIIRKPDIVPVWSIAGVFLLADFVLLRAPGLMAAGMVLASEYIKSREDLTLEVPFALEWTVAASMIASVMVGSSAILVVFGAPAPSLGPMLIKLILTILVYPLVVLVSRLVFGITRPGKTDEIGFGSKA